MHDSIRDAYMDTEPPRCRKSRFFAREMVHWYAEICLEFGLQMSCFVILMWRRSYERARGGSTELHCYGVECRMLGLGESVAKLYGI